MAQKGFSDSREGITRRRLVQVGAAGAAWALVGGETVARAAGAVGGSSATPRHLRRSTYLELTDRRFAVDGAGTELDLISVTDVAGALRDPGMRGHEEAFSLLFEGASGPGFAQATRTLRHSQLGGFELFVAPVGAGGSGQGYEAVVDRTVALPELAGDGAPRVGPGAAGPGQPPADAPGQPSPAVRRARRAALRRIGLRRGRSNASALCQLTLAPGTGAVAVRVKLIRGRRRYALGGAAVGGRRIKLRLFASRVLRPGRYTLVVTLRDAFGGAFTVRRRVRLR